MTWRFQVREIVCFGRVTKPDATPHGRWIVWDAPWTEDVRLYDCPMRVMYFGRRWCWSFGARHQAWDWGNSIWGQSFRRLAVYPTDHRERWEAIHGGEAEHDLG